ncbi:cache domain-containing sensor histidine kinase [Paenibacillus donghaensis]|uniref:Sensor histidine kinase n=1 Tax=Paenibacillus donghaensis TaxID=414771 RepID=A0A2Z2KVK4_9BACL|nr:sensor histidine kinase [Paenibacillus donghaensis]ASA23928.1 sensor histidine kinase [Paenibacillus donghaensis]
MKSPFKTYKIDNLFFRTFAGFMIIVLGCTVWASYGITSREMVRTNTRYQQQFLDKINKELASRLVTIEQVSLSTSRNNDLVEFLGNKSEGFDRYQESQKITQSLANLTYSIPIIQSIDLYMQEPLSGDSRSYIQFRRLGEEDKQAWYPAISQTDFAWSREHQLPGLQGEVPVLSFARKLIYDNKYLGILVIHIKSDMLKNTLAGDTVAVNRMMLDGGGKPLLSIGEAPRPEQLSEWITGKNGSAGFSRIHQGFGGKDSLFVYSVLPDYNWTLVEVTPWSQIIAGSVRLAQVIGMIGVAAVLLMLLLAHRLSRQFTFPIKLLVGAMSTYSVNGRSSELPDDYTNEFGAMFAGYRKQNERIEELYQSLQERYEQLRKAEIEALQANINPHFLYNTLDQLNWMAISAGQHEMSRILELMGRMFRIGLSNGESLITVEEELTHIQCYLEIQQLRYENNIHYVIDAPAEVQQLYLPKMLLQPFVENAVVHGFSGRSGGHIGISIGCVNCQLLLVIEDDGVGLGQLVPAVSGRRTGGYGIRNVRERIAVNFGPGYGVAIQERLEGGTRAEITLPLLPERPGQETAEPFKTAKDRTIL